MTFSKSNLNNIVKFVMKRKKALIYGDDISTFLTGNEIKKSHNNKNCFANLG